MKKVYMVTIMSFVLLGALSNSFAASEAAEGPQLVAAVVDMESAGAVLELVAVAGGFVEAMAPGESVVVESQEVLGKRLIEAFRAGDDKKINQLLEQGAPLHPWTLGCNPAGNTALYYALLSGNLDMARALLDAGADVNERNKDRDTGLIIAIKKNRIDLARRLLVIGADVNARNQHAGTALKHVRMMDDLYRNMTSRMKEYVYDKQMSGNASFLRMLILAGAHIGDAGVKEDSAESTVVANTKKGHDGWKHQVLSAVRDKRSYEARINMICDALETSTPLSGEIQDLVKDYEEVNDEFVFLQERAHNVAKKARAHRILKKHVGDQLEHIDTLVDLVLKYAPAQLVNALM